MKHTKEEIELSESLLAACKAAGIERPKNIAQDKSGQIWHYANTPDTNNHGLIWATLTGENKKLDHPPYAADWKESLLEWVEPQASESEDDACKIAYRAFIESSDCFVRNSDIYQRAWKDALKWSNGNKP